MVLSADRNLLFPFSSLRIIPYQKFPGAFNMAFDHFLAKSIYHDDAPVLRFYGWHPYCISLGYHQKVDNLDLALIKKAGYQAVRRPTGGSAIFHSEELTYSFIVPKTNLNQQQIYYSIHFYIAAALKKLGYNVDLQKEKLSDNYLRKGKSTFACFNRASQNEIRFKSRKVVGSAQKLYQNSILQHGSLLIGSKQTEITRFLKGSPKTRDEQSLYLKEHSISLKDINKRDVRPQVLCEAIIRGFCKNTYAEGYYFYPTAQEQEEAKKFENIFMIS